MRRNAFREGQERLRKALRGPPDAVPTLGRRQQDVDGKWLWVRRAAYGCPHRAPMAIAPLIIRRGPETSATNRANGRDALTAATAARRYSTRATSTRADR
jgi:hypothetical protein